MRVCGLGPATLGAGNHSAGLCSFADDVSPSFAFPTLCAYLCLLPRGLAALVMIELPFRGKTVPTAEFGRAGLDVNQAFSESHLHILGRGASYS